MNIDALLPILQKLLSLGLPLALVAAVALGALGRGVLPWLRWSLASAALAALAVAAVEIATGAVQGELYALAVLLPAIAAESALLVSLVFRKPRDSWLGDKLLVAAAAAFPILHRGPEIFVDSAVFLRSSIRALNSDALTAVFGWLAVLTAVLASVIALFQCSLSMDQARDQERFPPNLPGKSMVEPWAGLMLLLLAAGQILEALQILVVRGWVGAAPWLMDFLVAVSGREDAFFFACLGLSLLLALSRLLPGSAKPSPALSPAEERKRLAKRRRRLRWALASVCGLVLLGTLDGLGTVFAAERGRLSPADPVAAQEGQIVLPLSEVGDGSLHRFIYQASEGTGVRFIAIRKGSGSAYGVGLDACDICGPTGYFEREGQVICKLCDVVMNKTTIGYKGGCNPVPLPYRVQSGSLVLSVGDLEAERKRFQ